ncbi:8-amino-3,8-dideoxy-manno-octulosonate cytidylyltransferase [subsurface metagenome]
MKLATGIIPARYQSRRFPGKPLALIQGKPMIQRVYELAREAKFLDRLIIATDDEKILEAAEDFGAEVQIFREMNLSFEGR